MGGKSSSGSARGTGVGRFTVATSRPLSGKEPIQKLTPDEIRAIDETIAEATKIVPSIADLKITIVPGQLGVTGSTELGHSTRLNGVDYIYLNAERIRSISDPTGSKAEWFGLTSVTPSSVLEHVVAHEIGHQWMKSQSVKSEDLVLLPGGNRGRVETNPILVDWNTRMYKQHRSEMSGYARYLDSASEAFADSFASFVTGGTLGPNVEDWFMKNIR